MIELMLQAERLVSMGLLDQAERHYRQALEADPANAIAQVGLARIAVERGDDRSALDHAGAALGIDPENTAALRLRARLLETMPADQVGSAAPMAAGPTSASEETPARRGLLERLRRRS